MFGEKQQVIEAVAAAKIRKRQCDRHSDVKAHRQLASIPRCSERVLNSFQSTAFAFFFHYLYCAAFL